VRKHYGFEVEWIMGNELQNEYGLKGALGAIRSAQGASVDAYTLAYDLLAASVEKGLIVRDNTEVTKVEHDQDAVKVITCDGHRLKAKKLIYCNGFESTEILGRSFVKLLSTYATVGEQLPGPETVLDDVLFWNMADPYIYARATDDGRMLIGGEDEEFVDPHVFKRKLRSLKRPCMNCFRKCHTRSTSHGQAHSVKPRMAVRSSVNTRIILTRIGC